MACGLFLLFLLNIEVENRFNVRLADDHLCGKWLFTWLSLVMSLIVSNFKQSFFPRDVWSNQWSFFAPVFQ